MIVGMRWVRRFLWKIVVMCKLRCYVWVILYVYRILVSRFFLWYFSLGVFFEISLGVGVTGIFSRGNSFYLWSGYYL